MENKFEKHAMQWYSNFMKYTISNAIYNIILVILENSTILFIIDLMFKDKILGEALTPLYFLSPHVYLDMFNEKFPNECNIIFYSNSTMTANTTSTSSSNSTMNMYQFFNNNTPTSDIVFFGNKLLSSQNSYCIYSSKLIISIISIMVILTFFTILLFFINSNGKINPYLKAFLYFLTNSINLFLRHFFVVISIILINRPIVYLYHSSAIQPQYHTEVLIYTMVSLFFLVYAVLFNFINIKYINNVFYFETLPYDYFSNSENLVLLIIKIVIGLKVSYDKLLGLNEMSIMNLIIGVLIFVRVFCTVGRREYVVNHVYLKNLTAFLTFFYSFYILLKLLNEFLTHLTEYTVINFTMEIILIIIILVALIIVLFTGNTQFIFRKKTEFMVESMQFLYYVYMHLGIGKGYDVSNHSHSSNNRQGQGHSQHSHNSLQELKIKREIFIDNVIIGHKMKCKMEDCILCCEDIYNPDLKTLCLILYQQFLHYEKEYKEENEGMTLLIKLMYLKMIDERKIHRIAYTILKNIKNKNLSFATMLKINYMYQTNLEELNNDLKGLLTIKYGEFNDELLKCIKNFEDILGFIKSKTEKVELVTNKTNQIGLMYSQLIKDLHYLKKNKRIYFDPVNLLQIICVLRMVFPRTLDHEITANLDYNFIDFLEVIDQVFIDNISFLVRYDFYNKTWRIKKIPKIFIDMTKYRINELLDQSLEKIFPQVLSKSLIKKMEEKIILSSMNDSKLEFKTVISDKESNARYVKFVIDIIPHLENSYMMFMQCHFHRRQLLIIDEFGNFINGSHVLYDKVGINSDIVAASKGRINMYTMFNLDKKQKLDDITIVSIALEGVVNATRKLFLLEAEDNNNKRRRNESKRGSSVVNSRITIGASPGGNNKKQSTLMPNFLDSFIKNEANAQGKKKQKIVVFLHLFSTEIIKDIKYHVYNIRLSNPEDKEKEKDKAGGTEAKSGPRHTVAMKRINTDFSNSSEDKELLKKETTLKKKQTEKKTKENDDNNSSLNNFNYYYAFLDSQHSMSMTMNYKSNLESYNSSMANSITSDVFSYLYMKSINSTKTQSNKFESFILAIVILNILLILFGLSSIIYLQSYSSNSYQLLTIINDFYTMNGRIFKSTNVIFSFLKYSPDDSNFLYQDYISTKYQLPEVKYDILIQTILDYDLSKALSNITSFTSNAFNYFGDNDYNIQLNYETPFIHLDPSGEYTIKQEKMKYIIDLFTLTMNQLANKVDVKVFFNVSYMEYQYLNKDVLAFPEYMIIKGVNPALLDKNDKNYFNDLINLYQHFFNFFSSYEVNYEGMKRYIDHMSSIHFIKVHISSKALLIVIVLLNVIFLIICLSSVLLYQSILKTEFRGLYGISEDTIGKLKEKFQYVKELIKWEQAPSLVYNKIRKMREELEQLQVKEMKKIKKKEKEAFNQNKTMTMNTAQAQAQAQPQKNNKIGNDDSLSVMTTGSQAGPSSDYLRFSGAVKGLFRSSTLRAKEQLKKLSKETRNQRASQDLLNRLNFSFEMTKNFIIFIIFITFFYLILGLISIIINDSNFNDITTTLTFTSQFYQRFFNLFNFYSAVKLSIILNQDAPYSLYNNTSTPQCSQCILDYLHNYSIISGQLYTMEHNDQKFISISDIEQSLQGNSICTLMYSTYQNDLNDYIKSKASKGMLDSLMLLCNSIPILKSNIDTIFNEIIIQIRKVYHVYLGSDRTITTRLELLSNDFIEGDLLMTMFVHFYYEYITQNSIIILNKTIVQGFYSFVIIIFSINIIIDLFMIVFIWFKIYHQIISSVKNVQLVNESVSVI